MMAWLGDVWRGKRKVILRMQQERDRLEQLLSRFREERLAIDTMLTSATTQIDALKDLFTSLDEAVRRGTDASSAGSDVVTRLDALERRLGLLEQSEQHVEAVKGALIVLRKGLQELQAGQADVARLTERLEVERRALEDFEQRLKMLQTKR